MAAQKSAMVLGIWLAAGVTAGRPGADPAAGPDPVADRFGAIRAGLAELTGSGDLLDCLYFGWFDRPYARVRVTVLLKFSDVLDRELRLRARGQGVLDDVTMRAGIAWAEAALAGLPSVRELDGFQPHRESAEYAAAGPAVGFVDRASATRVHPGLSDFDLLASAGFRAYAMPDDGPGRGRFRRLVGRAADLSIRLFTIAEPARPGELMPRAEPSGAPQPPVRPLPLRDLLAGSAAAGLDTEAAWAIVDPPGGESIGAAMARRALARGASPTGRFVSYAWQPPSFEGYQEQVESAGIAALWAEIYDGQWTTLVEGWRDWRDGSVGRFQSIFARPGLIEALGRASLDLQRIGSRRWTMPPRPLLAIMVDDTAVDPQDDNRWAGWIEGLWNGLVNRQIAFDVLSDDSPRSGVYGLVVEASRLDPSAPLDPTTRIERKLAACNDHVHRLTLREQDGRIAAGVFLRERRAGDGTRCLAVVNISGRSAVLALRGGDVRSPVRDVLSGEWIAQPSEALPLGPWQVRLLVDDR